MQKKTKKQVDITRRNNGRNNRKAGEQIIEEKVINHNGIEIRIKKYADGKIIRAFKRKGYIENLKVQEQKMRKPRKAAVEKEKKVQYPGAGTEGHKR